MPCFKCNNTGQLPDERYYLFCGLITKSFCTCSYGEALWRTWLKSEQVQQAIREKRKKEIEKALSFSKIPQRWSGKTLETFDGQEPLKIAIHQYLDEFPQHRKDGHGLYLWSTGSGCGKTHLLSAVCRQVIQRYITPSIFMTEEQLYMKLRESFDTPTIMEKPRHDRFRNIECLFLDDLGATKITPWKIEVLTALVDHRLNNNLPTFFTSNYSLHDYENLLKRCVPRPERIPSRIHEICAGFIIEVKGADRRKKISLPS